MLQKTKLLLFVILPHHLYHNQSAEKSCYQNGSSVSYHYDPHQFRVEGIFILGGFPKMLAGLAKKDGLPFPDLKMVIIGGQTFTDTFRSDIIEHLTAVPLVSCTGFTYT